MYYRIFIVLVIILTAGCASTPKSYPPLEEARSSLDTLLNEDEIKELASVTLYQADEYLTLAEQALKDNDLTTADHYIYLSERKQEIAKELLLKHKHQQEIGKLKLQHQEMVTHAQNLETKRAQNKAKLAQQRANKLEMALGEYQAEETSRGTLLVINDLLFTSGGATLENESKSRLEPLLQYLQGNPKRKIIIEGHTDSVGDASVNKRLSQQRAQAVKKFLASRGIAETRIEARGFGEEVPVATNTTNAGRRLNRRVEVVIKTAIQ